MINGINSNVNNIQLLRATQAFKAAANIPKTENLINDNIQDNVEISNLNTETAKVAKSEDPLFTQKKDYINNFKNYLKNNEEYNLEDEDIRNALKYGDSILIDQIA